MVIYNKIWPLYLVFCKYKNVFCFLKWHQIPVLPSKERWQGLVKHQNMVRQGQDAFSHTNLFSRIVIDCLRNLTKQQKTMAFVYRVWLSRTKFTFQGLSRCKPILTHYKGTAVEKQTPKSEIKKLFINSLQIQKRRNTNSKKSEHFQTSRLEILLACQP